ncbi:MAG: hypothetical protein P857_887 [Candidatus Xenolissoclinum pacificiensis L6]|uniref:Uncharacterized protein n=1 Tax=Candidatus Xenolissoclinum pacificiensis L6 TaxID=1401685 RepID=W2V0W0_9RICK|nr:MAG: hypothetical protein P857_887 [Candidatus Xenolissoclinum pacificiensis L6]
MNVSSTGRILSSQYKSIVPYHLGIKSVSKSSVVCTISSNISRIVASSFLLHLVLFLKSNPP